MVAVELPGATPRFSRRVVPPPAAAPLEFVGYAVIMKRGLLVAETLTGLGVGQAVIMKRGVVVAATLGVTVCEGISVMSYIFVGVTAIDEVPVPV